MARSHWSAWKHFKQGTVEDIFDPNLKVVHVGLLCTQEGPSLRPSMSAALKMLAKTDEPLATPSNPPFIDENTMELNSIAQKLLSYCDSDDCDSVAILSHNHIYQGNPS
ncbi:putative non-specific serine/threonine protein kinase [Helianthus annuus]|nr:putative non-specific serine/threonine protein kinase [Helianthus annuus]